MKIINTIKDNLVILLESLIALVLLILNTFFSGTTNYKEIIAWIIFGLLVFDILIKLYNKYLDYKKEKELKEQNDAKHNQQIKDLQSIQKELNEQKEFNKEYKEKKEKSVKILNRFFSESLLNETDILKLAKSAQYYLLYVYSWSFRSEIVVKKTKKKTEYYQFKTKRQYPIFLEQLGFTRMGVNSTLFIINKEKLKQEKLHEIVNFKKFLNKNFKSIRREEFKLYLEEVKKQDKKLYKKYTKKGLDNYLKINFLLLESVIHSGNIGLVTGDFIGLNNKKAKEDLAKEVLGNIALKDINLGSEIKIKIKDYFKEQDFDILLEEISNKTMKKISNNRHKIKNELQVKNVIQICKKNLSDIESVLKGIKVSNYQEIASKMKTEAEIYYNALQDLNINID